MKKVGSPYVDVFETAIRRAKRDEGIMVAFVFSRDAYEEAARIELEDGLRIELRTVKELLKL